MNLRLPVWGDRTRQTFDRTLTLRYVTQYCSTDQSVLLDSDGGIGMECDNHCLESLGSTGFITGSPSRPDQAQPKKICPDKPRQTQPEQSHRTLGTAPPLTPSVQMPPNLTVVPVFTTCTRRDRTHRWWTSCHGSHFCFPPILTEIEKCKSFKIKVYNWYLKNAC